MSDWDEEALREINSLDSARLAIRGALATIRNLQEQNARAKIEAQDQATARRLLESRIADLSVQAERWQDQAKIWEEQDRVRQAQEESWRNSVKLEIRAEEKTRIGQAQAALEEELSRLRGEMLRLAGLQKEKEAQWADLKKNLERYQVELARAEREKIEIARRYHEDSKTVAELRERREREVAAGLRRLELESEDKQRQSEALRRENEELKKQLSAAALDLEKRLKEREETLLRDMRLKEQSLHERYSKRELELESSWAELENNLWQKAKAGRDQLDQIAEQQFAEKSRALAERSKEIDGILLLRQQELQDDYARKCSEAEARYAAKERELKALWEDKEKRFLGRYDEELAKEKAEIELRYQEKMKAVEAQRLASAQELARAKEELEADYRHRNSRILEEGSRHEAQRVRAQNDFIAKKTAELEAAFEARDRERAEEFIAKTRAAEEEFNRRRVELLQEQSRLTQGEKASLEKKFEERARALDADYEAKIAELAGDRRALEHAFEEKKTSLAAEYALKEKNLDRRWSLREQELVQNHEAAQDRLRRDFALSARKMEEEFEAQRKTAEAELNESYARKEQELVAKHEALVSQIEQSRRQELQYSLEKADSEKERLRQDAQGQIARLKEDLQRLDAQMRENVMERNLRIKALEEKLAESEASRRKTWDGLQRREKEWEAQRLSLEESSGEREALRERKYLQMEKSLRDMWAKREAEAVETRLKALEEQHRHYLEQISRNEEKLRAQFEEWKKEWAARSQPAAPPPGLPPTKT